MLLRIAHKPCDPPLFLNGVSGLGSPFWRPDFASRFVGDGDGREKVVAVAESIVFLLMLNLEEFPTPSDRLREILMSGGLSPLDGLCQRLADLSGLPPAHFCVPAGDILAEENLELAAAMKDAGVAIDLQIYAAATHSFLEAVSISSLAATALDASARWMRDTLEAA